MHLMPPCYDFYEQKSGKAKSWPSRHNLLVYQLFSTVRLSPSQLLPNYDFRERKSEKLAVASQSAGIPAVLYGTSVSKPAATLALRFLRAEE